jgi:hypothetical protein
MTQGTVVSTTPSDAWAEKIKDLSRTVDKAEATLTQAQGELEACEVARALATTWEADLSSKVHKAWLAFGDTLKEIVDE